MRVMYKSNVEKASVVFKEFYEGKYEVLKSRDSQLKLGGQHSQELVDFYKQTHDGVVVLGLGKVYLLEEENLKVGDYAKIVKTGVIVRVTEISTHGIEGAKVISGDICIGEHSKFVKATDEEVAEAKAKVAKADKWAKIGRKPNEYKKGDIVYYLTLSIEGLAIIADSNPDGARIKSINIIDSEEEFPISHANIQLITPVEARFDLA